MNEFGTSKKPGSLLLEARAGVRVIAKEMAQELRTRIYKQGFASVRKHPLNPSYLAWKRATGLDPRTLIATKKYVQAIGVVDNEFGTRIGLIRKSRMDKRGKSTVRLDYAKLQRWLEFGNKTMPPRPHWRPMMRLWRAKRAEYALRLKTKIGVKLAAQLAKAK